jgi:ATP-dependent DNA helicase RecQ
VAAEQGRDVLLVAPTGAGKSVAYWVPGIAADDLTLVVSPLIALMQDQVARLRGHGVSAAALHSHLGKPEQYAALDQAASGRLRFLYVAPERLGSPGFVNQLGSLSVARVVVDEAHCISSWGHDFRPDYRRLDEAISVCGRPPVGAFTATATPRVRDDIIVNLGLRDPLVRVTGFVRPELRMDVLRCRGMPSKREAVLRALHEKSGRALVYCGRTKIASELADTLRDENISAAAYHGALDGDERSRVQEAFAAGSLRVVVATSAFGMGVDIADIRQVIHVDFPGSIEAYYQEAGRAGRDGADARCLLLYDPADRNLQEYFIEAAFPPRDAVRAVYREMQRGASEYELEQLLPTWGKHVLRGALATLDRAGMRGPEGDVQRLTGAPVDFSEQEKLHEYASARVTQIMDYARTRGCRHARIADYFGEEGVQRHCEACDNCLTPGAPTVTVDPEIVTAALRCVARFDGYLGAARLTSILRGADDAWSRQRGWVRELSFFGSLSSWSNERIRDLLSVFIEEGLCQRGHGERPTLALSGTGRAAMSDGQATVEMPAVAPAPPKSGSRRQGRPTAPSADALAPDALALFERLRSWRRDRANRDGVPAYVVLHDSSLREIATRSPRTETELREIPGIGPAKSQRYATEVFEILCAT